MNEPGHRAAAAAAEGTPPHWNYNPAADVAVAEDAADAVVAAISTIRWGGRDDSERQID